MRLVLGLGIAVAFAGCGGRGLDIANDGRSSMNDGGPRDGGPRDGGPRDGGPRDGGPCTCIPPIDYFALSRPTCDSPTVRYGCEDAPMEMRLPFDIPPACFFNVPDTATGCTRPGYEFCDSCFPRPDAG